tara:strand:+ start:379 stop:639 length:261 start_codon:yes stop_codon:yes gene_type:complete
MVAIRRMAGKAEKSRGFELLIAIIIITSPTTMLNVNRKSSRNAGSGRINMDKINRTRNGIPSPDSSNFDRSCRRFDSVASTIIKKP